MRKKDGSIEYKVSYIGYHTDADQWLKEEQIRETNPILFNNFKTAIQEYDNNIGQLDENELLSTVLEELDTNVFTQLKDAREGISFNMLEAMEEDMHDDEVEEVAVDDKVVNVDSDELEVQPQEELVEEVSVVDEVVDESVVDVSHVLNTDTSVSEKGVDDNHEMNMVFQDDDQYLNNDEDDKQEDLDENMDEEWVNVVEDVNTNVSSDDNHSDSNNNNLDLLSMVLNMQGITEDDVEANVPRGNEDEMDYESDEEDFSAARQLQTAEKMKGLRKKGWLLRKLK